MVDNHVGIGSNLVTLPTTPSPFQATEQEAANV